MVKSNESIVTPAKSSTGDRIGSFARDEGSGSGSGDRSSGGRSRRPVPDSPPQWTESMARKRRHSEVETADDQGGEQQPGNDAEADTDAGVATPAAKHARRSLYGTVTNLMGRAVGLFTPGRAQPPADGGPSPTGGDAAPEVAVRDEVTTTSNLGSRGEEALDSHEREESLPLTTVTTGGTNHAPEDASFGLAGESTEKNDGDRETVPQPVVAPRGALRNPASPSPFIPGPLLGQDIVSELVFPLGTFRTRITKPGARMPSATNVSLASPVSRRVSTEGQGLEFASIRRSTTGEDETDAPVPTPPSPRRGETETETDHSLTPTQQRDLVRALRFRRGLPPAAAMYILSKMEGELASRLRDQILRELPLAPSAAQETSVVGSGATPVPAETATPLCRPIARRPNAPVDEDLARVARPVSTLMPPPPPSSSRRASMEAPASTYVIGGSRRLSLAARAGDNVRTPMWCLDDGVDLLSPSRRAQLAEERSARERSFALGTPGGARMWKRATSSTQGTPWAGRVQERSTPVRQKALPERGLGRSGPWGDTPSKNGLETPAEQTRRIISVLEDLGTPVSLHLPGPSPARNAQALRNSSSYIDDDPLPTRTLSVPYPFGNAPTELAPARLPPGRWAPRSETRRENPSMKSTDAGSDTTPLMTVKHKPNDEVSADIGDENRSAGSTDQGSDVAPVSVFEGASDGSRVDEPFVKRERMSADEASVVTPSEPGGKGPGVSDSSGGGGGDNEGERAPDTPTGYGRHPEEDEGEGNSATTPAKITLKKSGGAEEAESSSREEENAAEREKKLALRRRDREGRYSLSSKKTTERPQPKNALPMSLRLSDVEARRNSDMGMGWGMLSAPPKTPTKFWTCSGCYTRNFDFSADECNMCRLPKDFDPHYRNPIWLRLGGPIMYPNRYKITDVGTREGRLVSKNTNSSTNGDIGKAEAAEVPGESSSVAAAAPAAAPAPGSGPTVVPSPSPTPSAKPTVTFQEPESDASRKADQAVVATPQPPPTIEEKAPAPTPTTFTFGPGGEARKSSSGLPFTVKTSTPAAQEGVSAKTFTFGPSTMSTVASEAPATATAPLTTEGKAAGFTFRVNPVSATPKAPTAAPAPSPTVKPAFSLPSSQFTFAKPAQVATSATLSKPSFFPVTSVATAAPADGKESASSSDNPVTSLAAPWPAVPVFHNRGGFVFNPAQHKRTSSPASGAFNQAIGLNKRGPSSSAQVAPINPFLAGPTQTPTLPQASSHAAAATPSQSFATHSNPLFAGPNAMPAPTPAFASAARPTFNVGPPGRKMVRARRSKVRK